MSSPIFFGERPKGSFLGRTLEAWLLRWRSGLGFWRESITHTWRTKGHGSSVPSRLGSFLISHFINLPKLKSIH
ncbi:unnamed protein product [Prunus armeniaca]|uniref:Uncharacterized protein n=1 Tax=Prunus armeniaca TaxID=36596 RepID=A0A6J5WV51_PRUAR|nr:unnamed protein product [Prunus armeniaca]